MTPSTRLRAVLALFALFAILATSCGNETIVVTGPAVAPAIDEAPEPGSDNRDEVGDVAAESTSEADDSSQPADDTEGETPSPLEGFKLDFGGLDGDDDEDAAGDTGDAGSTGVIDATFLRQAAATTEASESYRFEVRFAWQMSDPTFAMNVAPETPLMTGEVRGTTTHMVLDFGPIFDGVFEALGGNDAVDEIFGDDLTMRMIDDGAGRLYMKVPMFAALAGDDKLPDEFAGLADGWGVVDLNSVEGLSAAEIANLTGTQSGSSPDELLALLRDVGAVEELGRADVRGVSTAHLRVTVSFADMIAAQGMDAAELGAIAGDVSGALDLQMPFDVFVDDEGRVRRVTINIDLATLESMGEADLPAGSTFSISSTVDFFDFGADIVIEVPSADEVVVDLTEALAQLAG